jgi:hypothetical protein
MRTVTVENNKIVVEVDGAKVRYPLEIVRKRINSLLQDLETWREYERLLTQLAVDETICTCSHDVYENVVSPGNCMACGKPFRH